MSSDSNRGTLYLLTAHVSLAVPKALLSLLGEDDCLVLLQDAVWLALASSSEGELGLSGLATKARIVVIEDDLQARGLSQRPLHRRVEQIDDDQWASLSERYSRCLSWGAR